MKLRYLENKLDDANEPTIIIIAEHWFSKFFSLQESRYFFCSTPLINYRDVGHQNGGLAVLASRTVIPLIKEANVSEFSIQFTIGLETIKAVYLPPRLSLEEVEKVISAETNQVSILLGDINVRFGKLLNDKRTWNTPRGQKIISILESYDMHLQPSTGKFSGNDHVFSRKNETWEYYKLTDAQMRTDHGMIDLSIPLDRRIPHATIIGQEKRYAFSILKDPIFRDVIKNDWITEQPFLVEFVGKVRFQLKLGRIKSYQSALEVINITYDTLAGAIMNLCERNFPTYDPENRKSQRATSQNLDSTNCSTVFAIRQFKRSQRLYTQAQKFKSSTDTDVLQEAVEYYSNIYSSTTGQATFDWSDELVSNHCWKTDADQIATIIKQYSSAKAAGPDGMHSSLLKCLLEVKGFSSLIAELFNICLEYSITPLAWNTSRIHLLMKDPLTPYIASSRAVSLTCMFRRFFEKIVLRNSLNETWSQLHANQAGFRKGWSTVSHILLNDDMCRSGFNISAYLDLKSAFDVVDHRYLFKILRQRGAPIQICKLIYSLMVNNCGSTIAVNGIVSETKIQRSRGLFQGSILSPMLFNMLIDILAEQITVELPPSTVILLFADDIVIKTNDWVRLQHALDICYNWSANSKIDWGIRKCGVISKYESYPVLLGAEVVPVVSQYKYLGLPFTANGVDWKQYLYKIMDKHNKFIQGIQLQSQVWTMNNRLIIYRTFVRPILDYCLPVLTRWISKQQDSKEMFGQLEATYGDGIKWIMGRDRPLKILEIITGLGSFKFRISQVEASLANHIHLLQQTNPLISYMKSHFLSLNKNFILMDCKKSRILQEWRVYFKSEKFPLKYRTWLLKQKWLEYKMLPGKLHHYILPRSRTKSGADKLMQQKYPIANKSLQWRCNFSFINKYCPECFNKFNRRHLARCNLYSLLDERTQSMFKTTQYRVDMSKINSIINQDAENYTVLDFYLNNGDYDSFLHLYDQISTLLAEV